MSLAGAGTIASILMGLYNGKGNNALDNTKSAEGRELLLTNGNLITLVNNMIVEPRIIIPKSLKNHEMINNIIDRQISTFVGLYSLGFKHMISNMGVDVNTTIRLLSSNKEFDLKELNSMTAMSFHGDEFNFDDITIEADKSDDGAFPYIRTTYIDIDDGKKTIKIPVVIKANIIYVNDGSIELLMDVANDNNKSISSRMDSAFSGEITWSEFWFPLDMLKRERKSRLEDHDNLIKDMRDMSSDAYSKLLTDGAVGFGKNYRFFIIPKSTQVTLENVVGRQFIKGGSQDFLDFTNSLGVSIIDDRFDIISTFISKTKGSMENSFKSFSGKNKDSKTDDILAYLAGMR